MRTRWMLVAAILVLTSIPGTLGLAEEAGGNPAPAVAATASQPAAATLPDWANLPTQTPAPQTPQGIADKPTFLINNCSSCTASPRCRTLHSCVLMGCC
jgi:hypothetical protein